MSFFRLFIFFNINGYYIMSFIEENYDNYYECLIFVEIITLWKKESVF